MSGAITELRWRLRKLGRARHDNEIMGGILRARGMFVNDSADAASPSTSDGRAAVGDRECGGAPRIAMVARASNDARARMLVDAADVAISLNSNAV